MTDQNSVIRELRKGLEASFVDKSVESQSIYQPRLLTNNFKEGKKVLPYIEKELSTCDEFYISVAFINRGGIEPLLQTFRELEKKGIQGKILTTDYLHFSEPEALRKLNSLSNIELRMYETSGNTEGFHTKGYIFKEDGLYKIIIGSSNLTQSALTKNHEWNNIFTSTANGLYTDEVLNQFEELWESDHAKSFPDFIDDYSKEYYAFREQRRREEAYKERIIQSTYEIYRIKPNQMQTTFLSNLQELREKGEKRALLISATGTGKTYASAFAIRDMKPKRVLFLVHREQIAKKSIDSYKKIFGTSVTYGLLSGTSKETGASFIFATRDTMGKEETLHLFAPDEFDIIVVDAYGIIGLNSKGSANKGFLKLSPILFSPQMRLMIDLRRKHAQNEDLSAKRSAACNSGSTVSDVVPSRLLQRQSAEHTPDVDLHRSTVRYSKDVSFACAA